MKGEVVAALNRRAEEVLKSSSGDVERERAAREELLRLATPLIDEVVEDEFSASGCPASELFRAGYLGLLNAVYNFDLARGLPFVTYAVNLIKGELRGHIRDRAARAVVPQWMHDLNRQIERAQSHLLGELGRLPTLGELAESVNITEDGIAEIFKAREPLSYVSLDARQRELDPAPRIHLERIRSLHPVPFPIEDRVRIASAIERLAELERDILQRLFAPERDGESTT